MARALLREEQIGDIDNLSEPEHDVLVHENLVTSGTLNFQDGTISGTGSIYAGSGIEVPWIQFDLTPSGIVHTEGKLHWNEDDGTLEVDMPGGEVKLQVGQETLLKVRNTSGIPIDNGDAVYVSGGVGNLPLASLADADSLATSGVIGIATEDIPDNNSGYVTTFGLVRDIDTSSWPAGTLLWLSTTSGELTSTRPTPPKTGVIVAISIRQHADEGVILVKIQIVDRLVGLSDVLSATPSEGEFLRWNSANSRFELQTTSSIDHGTLSGIGDDDHQQYLLADGSRSLTGDWDFGSQTISGTGDIHCDDIHTASDSFMYFGDTTTSGSWRMGISGEDFIHQKYNGSIWETEQRLII